MPFEELKARQSVMWGAGPFEEIAHHIASMHDELVEKLEPKPGERWLDVGGGTGAVAIRAARTGADVTCQDLSPDLIDTARRRATDEGVDVHFDVGDAENLPYEDASFDVVSSSVGAIFALDHAAVARELARVCRPDGRLGLTAWRPEGSIGGMFRMMLPFQPPLPPEAGNSLDWGREDYVEERLGEGFELRFVEGDCPFRVGSGEEAWEMFVRNFGPVKVLAASLEPERREEFHRAFVDFHEEFRVDSGIVQPRPYLLVLGTRR